MISHETNSTFRFILVKSFRMIQPVTPDEFPLNYAEKYIECETSEEPAQRRSENDRTKETETMCSEIMKKKRKSRSRTLNSKNKCERFSLCCWNCFAFHSRKCQNTKIVQHYHHMLYGVRMVAGGRVSARQHDSVLRRQWTRRWVAFIWPNKVHTKIS